MKLQALKKLLILYVILLLTSCVAKFIPEIDEDKELLVVQGLITDRTEADTIKLSRSLPLGLKSAARPVGGCNVTISDDQGSTVSFWEKSPGTYVSPAFFHGVIGRSYILHINVNSATGNVNYESYPMEMKPVPPIDSIYYEKTAIEPAAGYFKGVDGCQIYLDTHDPENNCRYYRWDFSETWVLRLPFPVVNQICWISDKSNVINIKSTAAFNEARVTRFPINYISNITDRLKTKYSINVNQYSLNEDEYTYWEKIQNVEVQVGGLYDLIPASIPSNIKCIEKPDEKILGYFSVSAKSSNRIFIKDSFEGIIDRYNNCVKGTIPYTDTLKEGEWILDDEQYAIPPYKVITDDKGCADCTVRGTNIKPDFWKDDK
jgi:hypothetical protein